MNPPPSLATPLDIAFEFQVSTDVADNLAKYDPLRITDETEIEIPVPVITIDGATIATEGNIITFSGASKSGKSGLLSIIMAGAISSTGQIVDPLELLSVLPNPDGKAVVHLDTEQARHRHQYNLRTVLKRAGFDKCPDYFLSYNIRQLGLSDYQPTTTGICLSAAQRFNGIHLLVIDGLADYVADVNDTAQSNSIIKYFEDIAIQHRTPVVVIVHTNPNSDKQRGNLGSQIQRKSESVLLVKNDGGTSYVEPQFLRMAGLDDVPALGFEYDRDKGYHVGTGIREKQESRKAPGPQQSLHDIAMEAFGTKSYGYRDAWAAIGGVIEMGVSASKKTLKKLKEGGFVEKGKDGLYRMKIESG